MADLPEPSHGETHVALVSGGMDSTAAAHVAVTEHGVGLLVYLDTGTGLESNRQYVEDLADELDAHLWTLRTRESYAEIVTTHGFPGPRDHPVLYRRLKERPLERLATTVGGRGQGEGLHLWTGVRRRESRNRMGRVTPVQEADRWTWVAPLAEWTKNQVCEHIAENDLPENPLWADLGRSGDCFCGFYGSPAELLDLRAAGEDEHADWLENLEGLVEDELADDVDQAHRLLWAWGGMTESERRAVRAELDPSQAMLCSTCGNGTTPRTEGGPL